MTTPVSTSAYSPGAMVFSSLTGISKAHAPGVLYSSEIHSGSFVRTIIVEKKIIQK